MESRRENLAEAFYQWEQRGRGWKLWSDRVAIEPYFVRFSPAPPIRHYENAGRVPSLGTRILRTLRSKSKSQKTDTRESEHPDYFLTTDEPPEFLCDHLRELSEFEIVLPKNSTLTTLQFESFILLLSQSTFPCSIELVANNKKIVILLSCRTHDRDYVISQLNTYLPEVQYIENESELLIDEWMTEPQTESLVVDLGLDEEFIKPIKSADKGASYSLTGVFSALNNLNEHETAIFQVIFQRTRAPWSESIINSVLTPDDSPRFDDIDNLVSDAKLKISKPLYATTVRLAVRATTAHDALALAQHIVAGLVTLHDPNTNKLIPLNNTGLDETDHIVDLLSRTSHRSGMILNANELITLCQFPPASLHSEKLHRDSTHTWPAPQATDSTDLVLGVNTHRGKSVEVGLSAEQRTRHTYVIGAIGTGKSNLLINNIIQDIKNGQGVAVLDPHGDLIDSVIAHIPPDRLSDVILIDPSDKEYAVGFNILQAHSEEERTLLTSDLTELLSGFSTSFGDQMRTVLDHAILAFLHSSRGGSLADLQRFLGDEQYREEFLSTVTDSHVIYYWKMEFVHLKGTPHASIISRLSSFLRPPPVRYMLAQRDTKLDLAKVMNEGKILLAKISSGLIGEKNAHLLGALLVSKINQAAMARQQIEKQDRRDFWLYIDEFHHFTTPSMENILSGTRKYRLGLTLGHQNIDQLTSRDSQIASSALSNPYTRICFRLGEADARKLASGFVHFDEQDLLSLDIGEAIGRFGRADHDFNLTIPLVPESDPATFQKNLSTIIENTRRNYSTPVEQVRSMLDDIYVIRDKVTPVAKKKPPVPDIVVETPPAAKETESTPPEPETPQPITKSTPEVHPTEAAPIEPEPEPPSAPSLVKISEPVKAPPPRKNEEKTHLDTKSAIKELAQDMNYFAETEKLILNGKRKIDISLEKGDLKIAIEVVNKSSTRHETSKIKDFFKAGYDYIVYICIAKVSPDNLAKMARETVKDAEWDRLFFLNSPEDLGDVFVKAEARIESENVVQIDGYTVRFEYEPPSKAEAERVRARIYQTVVDSKRRRKQSDN